MAVQHWSFISATWYEPIIDPWKAEGCYGEIARRLGYRFSLVQSVIPEQVSQEGRLRLCFTLKNEGFATLFNPRPVQIVLGSRASQAVYSLSVKADPAAGLGAKPPP